MLLHRLVCAALLGASLLPLASDATTPEQEGPPLVSNERQGYAFEFPRVLAQQRLFGIAHGVSLLATACLDVPTEAAATSDAYTAWYESQELLIDTVRNELAAFYFGPRADEARWKHLVRALNLREQLGLAADSKELAAACMTLPEALRQPRYDLNALFQLEAALAIMGTAMRVETESTVCMTRLPAEESTRLKQRHAEWLLREEASSNAARLQMLHYWQSTATPGTAEGWLNRLRENYAQPPAVRCAALADWLQTPAAVLANSFAPAPAPAAATSSEDHAVMAVNQNPPVTSAIGEASEETSTLTEAQHNPIQGLFDFLMKVFDERPHENQTAPAHGEPGRSQRTHP